MRPTPAVPNPEAHPATPIQTAQTAPDAHSPATRAAMRRMTMLPEDAEAAVLLRLRKEREGESEDAFSGRTFGRPGRG